MQWKDLDYPTILNRIFTNAQNKIIQLSRADQSATLYKTLVDSPDARNKLTEEELKAYLEKYGHKEQVNGNFRGNYTICDIHRKIYRMLIDEVDKFSEPDRQEEVKFLLQQAYAIAKKTDARLRQHRGNYDDDWYRREKLKHEEWMRELKNKK